MIRFSNTNNINNHWLLCCYCYDICIIYTSFEKNDNKNVYMFHGSWGKDDETQKIIMRKDIEFSLDLYFIAQGKLLIVINSMYVHCARFVGISVLVLLCFLNWNTNIKKYTLLGNKVVAEIFHIHRYII